MPSHQDRYTAYNQPEAEGPGPMGYLALFCSWAVPGLGHIMLGQRARGIIFMVTIHLLFAGGLLIGGIRVINPPDQPIWRYTQMLTGWPMVIASQVEQRARRELEDLKKEYEANRPNAADDTLIPLRKDYAAESIKTHPLATYHPKPQDMGSVYCGIAGMLNLLVMFDVLLRITGSTREDPTKKTAQAPVAQQGGQS